jgi:hypothetical protein
MPANAEPAMTVAANTPRQTVLMFMITSSLFFAPG